MNLVTGQCIKDSCGRCRLRMDDGVFPAHDVIPRAGLTARSSLFLISYLHSSGEFAVKKSHWMDIGSLTKPL